MSIPFTWVYLLHDPFTDLYKIGKSDRPDERHQTLCNPKSYGTIPAAPTQYSFLEAWLCPENEEAALHKVFAEYRVRGEWFDLATVFDAPKNPGKVEGCFVDYGSLSSAKRWHMGCSEDSDMLEILRHDFDRMLETARVMYRRLEQAKMLGYAPIGLLAPKPAPEPIEEYLS